MNTLALMSESLTLLSTLQQTVATAKQTIAAIIEHQQRNGTPQPTHAAALELITQAEYASLAVQNAVLQPATVKLPRPLDPAEIATAVQQVRTQSDHMRRSGTLDTGQTGPERQIQGYLEEIADDASQIAATAGALTEQYFGDEPTLFASAMTITAAGHLVNSTELLRPQTGQQIILTAR